jgi:hypothetical protein
MRNLKLSWARFSGPIQIDLEIHIPSSTTDIGSFSQGKNGRVLELTTHFLLA